MLPGKSCLARQILWGSTPVRQNTSGTSKWISLNREHTFHCTWVSRSPHVPGSWSPTTGTNVCTTLLMSSWPILGQKKSLRFLVSTRVASDTCISIFSFLFFSLWNNVQLQPKFSYTGMNKKRITAPTYDQKVNTFFGPYINKSNSSLLYAWAAHTKWIHVFELNIVNQWTFLFVKNKTFLKSQFRIMLLF